MDPDRLTTILHDAAAGDQAAWRELVALYTPRVYGLLRSQSGSEDLAEEITQSVFCTVADKLGHRGRRRDAPALGDADPDANAPEADVPEAGAYEEQGRFEAWLFRIAMNRLRDEMRRRKRRSVVTGEDELLNDTVRDGRRGDAPVQWADPTGGAEQQERIRALRSALAALPEADRRVLELRHLAEMSFRQIADLLDQPLGTVLARQHRALRKLKAVLEAGPEASAVAAPGRGIPSSAPRSGSSRPASPERLPDPAAEA